MTHTGDDARALVDEAYRTESRRALATLIRLLRDFDLAEEALHEAFAAALEQWPREGVPVNPRAWLVSAGRFKAIDAMRRRARYDETLQEALDRVEVWHAACHGYYRSTSGRIVTQWPDTMSAYAPRPENGRAERRDGV
mgnify:CR=1 FL=1